MQTEKYKVGDKLLCLPGFEPKDHSGGAGWIKDGSFIVARISDHEEPDRVIYWPKEGTHPNTNGIYGKACKKVDVVINNYSIF